MWCAVDGQAIAGTYSSQGAARYVVGEVAATWPGSDLDGGPSGPPYTLGGEEKSEIEKNAASQLKGLQSVIAVEAAGAYAR